MEKWIEDEVRDMFEEALVEADKALKLKKAGRGYRRPQKRADNLLCYIRAMLRTNRELADWAEANRS